MTGSPRREACLHFFCGKMAAGKSTMAAALTHEHEAVLLSEDQLLTELYPEGVPDLAAYVRYSRRIRAAFAPLIVQLLRSGRSVVLDFPGNTRRQREWFRGLINASGAAHRLHFIDVSDEVCLAQLRQRSAVLSHDAKWTTEEEFRSVNAYFEPPGSDEGFAVVRHGRRP